MIQGLDRPVHSFAHSPAHLHPAMAAWAASPLSHVPASNGIDLFTYILEAAVIVSYC